MYSKYSVCLYLGCVLGTAGSVSLEGARKLEGKWLQLGSKTGVCWQYGQKTEADR